MPDVDVVVVGAGFAGLYMLHKLRQLGFSARSFEAGDGVGGTWYWNRYPGARCDTESMEYSYGFDDDLQQEWHWTERYATQPEIERYANHVADRYDLRRDITFNTRVASAAFDEADHTWRVQTDGGEDVVARYVVFATGCLSSANVPDFEGFDEFDGEKYHTGRWPKDGVDFTGKRVAVIGTGSSAIQSIPIIAEHCAELTVFQRTPNYAVPAWNQQLDPEDVADIKEQYQDFRAANRTMAAAFGSRLPAGTMKNVNECTPDEIRAELDKRWEYGGLGFLAGFTDVLLTPEANRVVAEYVREKIRATVNDPEVAELLSPQQVIGCKRLCVDTGYYETFNREHVRLVDINKTPIARITADGIETVERVYPVDTLVFATGFDAMTGALLSIDVKGRGGVSLRDAWAAGPRTYLGLGVVGFPNMFTITGPGSPSVLTNMMVSIQQHVDWVGQCLADLRAAGVAEIEAEQDAQDMWVEYVNTIAGFTLFPTCNSWYLGANVPGKTRVFMPLLGYPPYEEKCRDVAAKNYEGFTLVPA
ncbi:MAG TPA: NAD(P)/FAD-dependent oxidoreductase [Acidimicrobiales bacterium]|nr:NAD(P)/FAD-dependent oxidoreductase [Acidimicrobiales bacterium]